jgi:hypothetical protein
MTHASNPAPRAHAVVCARRIFYRPAAIVDDLIAAFAALPANDYPGSAAVAQACYERPIRMSGTRAVFGLRARHWPMLNLLDAAERDRRAFAAAMSGAVSAARGEPADDADGVA